MCFILLLNLNIIIYLLILYNFGIKINLIKNNIKFNYINLGICSFIICMFNSYI